MTGLAPKSHLESRGAALGGCPLNPGSQAGWQPGSQGVNCMALVGRFFFSFPSLLGYSPGGRSELSKCLLLGGPGVVRRFPSRVPIPPGGAGTLCA